MSRLAKELKSKFKDEQHEALLNMLFTASWLRHIHTGLLREFDISVPQFNILRILRGAKGEKMSMQEVRSRMVDRSPNATRLTDGLIRKGYVERIRCTEDRRVVRVCITEQGLNALEMVDLKVEPEMAAIAHKWNTKEAEHVNRLMDELRETVVETSSTSE